MKKDDAVEQKIREEYSLLWPKIQKETGCHQFEARMQALTQMIWDATENKPSMLSEST